MTSHYAAILGGYTVAIAGWWLAFFVLRRLDVCPPAWTAPNEYALQHPWRELACAMVGAVGVILVGQMWSRGWLLPATGWLAPLIESINQGLIFLPVLLVPCSRRQGPATMLLPEQRYGVRLLTGLLLAYLAVCSYAVLRDGSRSPWEMVRTMVAVENMDEIVQVLCEDLAIGILLYRLAAAIRNRWAIVSVAALFAAGHVPSLLASGATPSDLSALLLDFGLVVFVLGTVLRSGDVLWFWPIHAALDLTQFTRVSGL